MNESRRNAADEWFDRMLHHPPPCQPDRSTAEVEVVRRELGVTCNDLGRCRRVDD